MNAAVSQAIVLILGSLGLGLVLTLPMLSMIRFGYLLLRLRQRQQTEIGKLAYPPLMLSYVEDQRLQTGLFLTPVCVNTLVIFGLIGLGNWWYWGWVFIVETLAVLITVQFRGQQFVTDASAYLNITARSTRALDGLITCQEVALNKDEQSKHWGRVITVLEYRSGDEACQTTTRRLFVTFPFEAKHHLRDIPDAEPVRIFFTPARESSGLPEGIIGNVVGVQSIRSSASGSGADWWSLFADRAHYYR